MIKWNENTGDALRNTAAVLAPLVLLYRSAPEAAVGIAVGVLLISLTDMPGNRRDKRRSSFQCILLFTTVSTVFSLCLFNPLWTGIALVSLTFLLAMLPALGMRSGLAGAMATALMVFMLGLHPPDPWSMSFYILAGGCWFYLVTLVQVYLFPFRSLRQALQEAREAMGELLAAKAACYDPAAPLQAGYRNIIKLHIKVWEKQELIRQLLLSDRGAMRKENLVQEALRVIGLYEQVIAMHYDYAQIREVLTPRALTLSRELGELLALQAATGTIDDQKFDDLATELASCDLGETDFTRGIVTNVRAIRDGLASKGQAIAAPADARAFVPDQGDYLSKISAHLHWGSPVLRFALRLAVLLGIGYTAATLFSADHYSYWLLLTILIVARPKLSVTFQRNWQRLAGTGIGLLIAAILLWLIASVSVLLIIAALALFGFFAWNRPKYAWSVVCVTVCVLLSLSVYRGGPALLLTARVGYSLAGCLLAILGVYLFPVWSHKELEGLVSSAVGSNREFLAKVGEGAAQEDIWLSRKTAHMRLARLSEGLAYARHEPLKNDLDRLEHIQVLNYRINAVIISLFLSGRKPDVSRSLNYLDDYLHNRAPGDKAVSGKLLKGVQLLESLTYDLARA